MINNSNRLKENRLNLDLASLGQLLDSHAGPCWPISQEVSFVYLIDLCEIVHVNEIEHVLHCMLAKIEPIVLDKVLKVGEGLLCLSYNLVLPGDKCISLRI